MISMVGAFSSHNLLESLAKMAWHFSCVRGIRLWVLFLLLVRSTSQSLRAHDASQNATDLDGGEAETMSWPPRWAIVVIGCAVALLTGALGVSLSLWLNSRAAPPYMVIPEETAELMQSLQETHEINKVRVKFDFRVQQRLKWILGTRTAGQLTTIARSRLSSDVKLAFELVVMVAVLYYVDLTLDIQACITFWQTGNPKFFLTNAMASVELSAAACCVLPHTKV